MTCGGGVKPRGSFPSQPRTSTTAHLLVPNGTACAAAAHQLERVLNMHTRRRPDGTTIFIADKPQDACLCLWKGTPGVHCFGHSTPTAIQRPDTN